MSIYLGNLTSESLDDAFSNADHASRQNVIEEDRDDLSAGDEISPQIRRKGCFQPSQIRE